MSEGPVPSADEDAPLRIGDHVRIGSSPREWVVTGIVWQGDGADLYRPETGLRQREHVDRLTRVTPSAACASILPLRWGSATCDNPEPGHDEHSQAASGRTWTDADVEQALRDRENV